MTPVMATHAVTRRFIRGAERVTALDAISVEIHVGDLTVVAGPSGSGKTTLIGVLAGHEKPDAGTVETRLGKGWHEMSFVPQSLALIEELSIRENVELPALLSGNTGHSTEELLAMLDIADLADRLPAHVSGGEQQRAALARALRLSPALLLADEPTGHQDPARVRLVLDVLRSHAREGHAVLVSSHDEQVIALADRVLMLHDGRLAADTRNR
ncbi:ATP-binding cassette domain-containing protein [Dactylosporangium sp. AC04546]|uniref:ABC transporter ATP-binding protein n=1 Tax=Dactylosporangium sp. AC04546 TaxID=2862460 RepID=UPI001EDE6C08|nr:ATP-binding cassette domain-containing protein [Dactylosporangium sp. AC04546]WVK83635.1 ATP-binding cassette domain-containing protein [Dactylosporangium sp. AC04546]